MEFFDYINGAYKYLEFLAPYKGFIMVGTFVLGIGCIILAVKAKRNKSSEDN